MSRFPDFYPIFPDLSLTKFFKYERCDSLNPRLDTKNYRGRWKDGGEAMYHGIELVMRKYEMFHRILYILLSDY